jgi:hypothetical protein
VVGYSRLVGEYPFSAATALAGPLGPGTGGMEYPMVTITEPSAIVHEVGHNWFQGILASNERVFPWLDEGVNSFTENRVKAGLDSARAAAKRAKTPAAPGRTPSAAAADETTNALGLSNGLLRTFGADGLPSEALTDALWQASVSRGLHQPIAERSENFASVNYGTDVYLRAPATLRWLQAYLGAAQFDSCMHAYYRAWAFRHPQPADMLAAFSARSGQDLTWFFRDQLTTPIRPDAGLERLRVSDSIRVRVVNGSDSLLTVPVATVDAAGRVLAQRWTPLFREQGVISLPLDAAARAVVIDPKYQVPSIRRADDRIRLSGPLRKWNPVRVQPLLGFERWDRTALTWLPLLGANTTDKLMAGLYLSNSSLVQRRTRFQLAPLYSFGQNRVNGYGDLAHTIIGNGALAEITTAGRVARFERFLKLEPSLTLRWRPTGTVGLRQNAQIGVTLIRRDKGSASGADGGFGGARWARYGLTLGNALHRLTVNARFENFFAAALTERLGANILKADATYEYHYSKRRAVRLRAFGGRVVTQRRQDYFFLGLSGSPDYLRESVFLDRARISRALTAGPRQTDERDGAFRAWLPVLSNRWLATTNLEVELPKLPLTAYADLGATPGVTDSDVKTYYGAGLTFNALGNVLRIHLPIVGSNYAQDTPASWGDFSSNIRFALHLENWLPERQIRSQLAR